MLLEHFIEPKRVLRYDPQTGMSDELDPTEVPDSSALAFGFFADSQYGLWGVYASPSGPVLFHGTRRFPLTEPSTKIDLDPGNEENRFSLRQGGVVRAECRYRRPDRSQWGFDSWSTEEESADFFLWLKNQFLTDDFVVRFTRPQDDSLENLQR